MRELDALIAEHVLGYHREKTPPDANGEYSNDEILIPPGKSIGVFYTEGVLLPMKGRVHEAYFVPRFSADYAQALLLLKRFSPPRYYTRIVLTDSEKWRCDIDTHGGDGPVHSFAHDDIRVAICLAVLATADVTLAKRFAADVVAQAP